MQLTKAENAPEVKGAREIMALLQRAYKEQRLYPRSHPSSRIGLEALLAALQEYLTVLPSLALSVSETAFMLGDIEVYAGPGASKENLAFLMFRDGLRRISVNAGATTEEVEAFVECLAKADGLDREDQDLVTLLWEADLINIDYAVADPFLSGDYLPSETVHNLRDVIMHRLSTLGLPREDGDATDGLDMIETDRIGWARDFSLTLDDVTQLERLGRESLMPTREYHEVLLDIMQDAPDSRAAAKAARAYGLAIGPALRLGGLERAEAELEDLFETLAQSNHAEELSPNPPIRPSRLRLLSPEGLN